MKLATLRTPTGTIAVHVTDDGVGVEIPGIADVAALLRHPDYTTLRNTGTRTHDLDGANWAPVVPRPGKIICVGLNYRKHITEMGRDIPQYPTLFAKFPETITGPYDPIEVPDYAAHALDWEGELAVIIGKTIRRADHATATQAIAGYSVLNDLTMRDYQYRTGEWLQGKTFEASTPMGPVMVTPDEFGFGDLRTTVNGEIKQHASTKDLVFHPARLVEYISAIITLNPGDVIATGTPGGVGHARTPAEYLSHGHTVTTEIHGIGQLTNTITVLPTQPT
jgi:acylpyruvate hydrolase